VAKTRRSPKASRRGPSSARGKSKRPAGKVKKVGKAATRSAPKSEKSVNLKEIRKQFALMLSGLSKKSGSTPAAQAKLDDTRRRVSQWLTDIDDICTPEEEEICGSTMVFPIP
jgi:hypothetical protein